MSAVPVVIVDDVRSHQEVLEEKLRLYCPEVTVQATCADLTEAEVAINRYKPLIVFLDIELGAEDGFEVLKRFSDHPFKVIFVSAHGTTANLLRAIKVSAAGFVAKPIDKDDLQLAVSKALQEADILPRHEHLKALAHNLAEPEPTHQMLLVSNKAEGEKQLPIGKIVFCESENTKVHFRMADKSSFTVTGSLGMYEELLQPYGFYRIQRSYLINIRFVDRVLREPRDVIMAHYPDLEIGGSRDKELWNRFIEAWESLAIRPR